MSKLWRCAVASMLWLACAVHTPRVSLAYSQNPTAPYANMMAIAGVYAADDGSVYSLAPFSPDRGVYALLFLEFATGGGTFMQDAGGGTYQGSADPAGKGPVHWRVRPMVESGAITGVQIWDRDRAAWRTTKKVALHSEEVEFKNGDVSLAGTFLKRADIAGKVPAVILGHGSGYADRAHFPGLPHFLANLGFGVFFYDKRGAGYSTGDFARADFDELSADLLAALNTVAARADVDTTKIGMAGVSQGPWLIFKAARKTPLISFIVSLWGTPYAVGEQGVYALIKTLEAKGVNDLRVLNEAAGLQRLVNEYLVSGKDWDRVAQEAARLKDRPWFALSNFGSLQPDMRSGTYARYVGYDPADDIRAFKGPVLYMVGAYDQKVDPENSAQLMRRLLDQGKNPDYATHVMARSHHGMLYQPDRFSHDQFEGVVGLAPEFWNVMQLWLRQHVALPAPGK